MVCGGQGSGRQIMNCSAPQLLCVIHQWLHLSHKCILICMTVPVMCMALSSFFNSMEPRIPLLDMGRDCAGHKNIWAGTSQFWLKMSVIACYLQGVTVLPLSHMCSSVSGCTAIMLKKISWSKDRAKEKACRQYLINFWLIKWRSLIFSLWCPPGVSFCPEPRFCPMTETISDQHYPGVKS